ncbi:MAG TPA: glycosyl transferase family 2 [Desulfobacteraceae bacterium]|nr:glycosyl transferase family 2 [Desulfobacteraceae bacterium]|tara:strand:- start:854 stop:1687 length:834 start_codon:yes stop_codon:yes gene_type:complete
MKVSVIVTTYNRPDALKKVLDGLVVQTRLPDEIVVADDGSGVETKRMLSSYLVRDDIAVKHVWQSDKGFRAARIRNKAILASTGEYLLLMDGDCIPEEHFVADHVNLARPGSYFQGKRVLVNRRLADQFSYEDITRRMFLIRQAVGSGISNGHHLFRLPFFPSYGVKGLSGIRTCNMGIFREDVIAINGFNQSMVGWGREDSEFVIRLYRFGVKRREHPFRAICYHLWHPENTRDGLAENERILDKTKQSAAWACSDGITQLINQSKNSRPKHDEIS